MAMIYDFYTSVIINMALNETYIFLLLKSLNFKYVVDYQPISLIPYAYKIIACVPSNRLILILIGKLWTPLFW